MENIRYIRNWPGPFCGGVMERDFFGFRSEVYTGGHHCVDVRKASSEQEDWINKRMGDEYAMRVGACPRRCLVRPLRTADRRVYMPLRSEPSLFLTFAKTEPTEEGIIAFADRFGFLALPCRGLLTADSREVERAERGFRHGHLCFCEGWPLDWWVEDISAMRRAVELWEAVRRGDAGDVSRRLEPYPSAEGVMFQDTHRPEWPPSDPYRAALLQIESAINTNLGRGVYPRVCWDSAGTSLNFTVAPLELLGALWLQFAWAVAGKAEYRACRECGRLFEVSRSESGSRADRMFCSTGCRVKAYRQRQEKARAMFAAGKNLKEIAKALDCKAEAVRAWVKGTRRGG
jgi:hypothetical protein